MTITANHFLPGPQGKRSTTVSRMFPVQQIIGTHDRQPLCPADTDYIALRINFLQDAFPHMAVIEIPAAQRDYAECAMGSAVQY